MKPSINIKSLLGLLSAVLVGCLFIFSSCVGTDNTSTTTTLSVNNATTGSIGFEFAWQNIGPQPAPTLAPQFDECVDYGVDEFVALVYDSNNNLAKGAVWPCASHQKIISDIKQGVNNKIEVQARKSGNVLWSGQKSGLIVISNATVNAGTIMMTYVGSDFTKPSIASVTPQTGLTNVPITAQLNAIMSEPLAISTVNSTSFTLFAGGNQIPGIVSYTANTATFTPSSVLSYSTLYTATITNAVTDMAGNRLASTYSWSFTTEPVPAIPPQAPTGISAVAGDASVTVSWSPTTGATGYNIYWSMSSGVTNITGTKIVNAASPFVHTGRTNSVTYYYVVSAYNTHGEGPTSTQVSATPVDVTPPDTFITSTPSSLSSSSLAAFQFLATESNCIFECSLDGSAYASCTSPASYAGLVNGSHSFGVRSIDPSLNIDPTPASYFWTVDLSPPPSVVIGAPTGVAATAGDQKVTLTWNSVSGATGYNLYWSTTAGVTKATGTRIAGVVSPYVHTNRVNGTTYFYVATALKGYAESADSIQSSTTPNDTIPPIATITDKPPLKFNSSTASFSFEASKASTFECKLESGAYSLCTSPATYSGLADGSHTFSVRATDIYGNLSSVSTYTWSINTVAPTLVSSNPSNGANNISITNTISVLFSKTIDASTVNTTTIDVRDGSGTKVNGTVVANANPNFTFVPLSQLNISTTYTVTVSSDVKDTFGNSFVGAFWMFTTGTSAVWAGPAMFGTSAIDVGRGIATDTVGNIYVLGETLGSLDGSAVTGKRQLFLTKYSSAGVRQWLVQFGNANDAFGIALHVDLSGNAYLVSETSGSFDGNTGIGGKDILVAKFDSNGAKQWSKLYGSLLDDLPKGIDIDSTGNIYVVGTTYGNVYGATLSGASDMFMLKLDGSGNIIKSTQIERTGDQVCTSLSVDRDDNPIVGGYHVLDPYTYQGWIYKFDSAGSYIWNSQTPGNALYAMTTDPSGNIYTASWIGVNTSLTKQTYLAQIDTLGTVKWTTAIYLVTLEAYNPYYPGFIRTMSIAADGVGGVYFVGYDVAKSYYTVNIIKLDTFGTFKLKKTEDIPNTNTIPYSITIDPLGDMLVTGYTNGVFGANVNQGQSDVFILRYNSDGTMLAPGVKRKLKK